MAEKFGPQHLQSVVDACKLVREQMECLYENHDKLRESGQHIALARRLQDVIEYASARAGAPARADIPQADVVCLLLRADLLVLEHKCLMLSDGTSTANSDHAELALRCQRVCDAAHGALMLRELDDVERAIAAEIASRAPEMPSAEPTVATVAEPVQVHLEPTSGDREADGAASGTAVDLAVRPEKRTKREKKSKDPSEQA